jgi:hypothetical protein
MGFAITHRAAVDEAGGRELRIGVRVVLADLVGERRAIRSCLALCEGLPSGSLDAATMSLRSQSSTASASDECAAARSPHRRPSSVTKGIRVTVSENAERCAVVTGREDERHRERNLTFPLDCDSSSRARDPPSRSAPVIGSRPSQGEAARQCGQFCADRVDSLQHQVVRVSDDLLPVVVAGERLDGSR